MNRILASVAAMALAGALAMAQSFPPGYVDPAPLLAAASKEIGEANLRCITFSGAGYDGAVGQTFEYTVNIDWPRTDAMANYTRTINWETGHEQRDLRPQARAQSGGVEIRTRLAWRYAYFRNRLARRIS